MEFRRMTLLPKGAGLDEVARKTRPVESSHFSLHAWL